MPTVTPEPPGTTLLVVLILEGSAPVSADGFPVEVYNGILDVARPPDNILFTIARFDAQKVLRLPESFVNADRLPDGRVSIRACELAPAGGTTGTKPLLYDAVGETLNWLTAAAAAMAPSNVDVIAIVRAAKTQFTGKTWTLAQVKTLIQVKKLAGWRFTLLGTAAVLT